MAPISKMEKKTNGKGNVHLSVWITPEEDELLNEMARVFNVRKGKVVSLAIRFLYSSFQRRRDRIEAVARSRREIRGIFKRWGIELGDRDFLLR